MGQAQTSSVLDAYSPNANIIPGTYRIIHAATNKALQTHEENPNTITLEHPQSEDQVSDFAHTDNDRWFVLHSGDGFIFKHCRENNYVTAPWSASLSPQPVRATRYPTTWAIYTKRDGDGLKCVIATAADQYNYSLGGEPVGLVGEVPQHGVCFARLSGIEEQDRLWRLERIGDATVEEELEYRVREIERELEAANAQWDSSESRMKEMLQQLEVKEATLENVRSELSNQAAELETVKNELTRQTVELKKQYKALDEMRELLDAKEQAISKQYRDTYKSEEIPEKEQEVSLEEEEGLHEPNAAEEAVSEEQVHEATVQQPQLEDNRLSVTLSSMVILQPVTEPTLHPQNVQNGRLPPPAAVDLRLAQLGWAFD